MNKLRIAFLGLVAAAAVGLGAVQADQFDWTPDYSYFQPASTFPLSDILTPYYFQWAVTGVQPTAPIPTYFDWTCC